MKKYVQCIGLLIGSLLIVSLLFSCGDMLDEKAYSKIINSDIEDSDAGADMWAMGAYNGLSRMYVYDEFPRCFDRDNDYVTGATWAFGEAGAGNFQGSTLQVDPLWKLSYELVNRCNEAIHHVEEMNNVTQRHKENVLGELYFLKAYGYYLIAMAYGDAPIFLTSINQGNDPHQPRQPVKVVFEHIIELLNDAKDMVYKNTEIGFTEGRVCAGAAASLLAKVYATIGSASMSAGETVYVKGGVPFTMSGTVKVLTQPQTITVQKKQVSGFESFDSREYYTLARDLAKSIVVDKLYGNHELIPYSILWKRAGRTSEEHLFSLQTKSGDEYFGALFGYAYSGQLVDGVVPNSGGLHQGLRDHWYKLFENDDYRITEGVLHRVVRQSHGTGGHYYPGTDEMRLKARGEDSEGNKIAEPVAPFNDGRNYTFEISENLVAFTTKYADVSDRSIRRTDAMYPFLRYADVVLIYAEASNEVDGLNTDALEALNSVRRRSNASEKWFGAIETGGIETKENLRSAILEERAMELALEGNRRWDLIRWGIYLDVMNAIGTVDEINISKTRESKHLLYPIPQDEILSNNAITGNNPGWN